MHSSQQTRRRLLSTVLPTRSSITTLPVCSSPFSTHFHHLASIETSFCQCKSYQQRYFATGGGKNRNGIPSNNRTAAASSSTANNKQSSAADPSSQRFSQDKLASLLANKSFDKTSSADMEKILKDYESRKDQDVAGEKKPLDMDSIMGELRQSGNLRKDRSKGLRLLLYILCVALGMLIVQLFSMSGQIRALERDLEVQRRLLNLKWKKKLLALVGQEALEKEGSVVVGVTAESTTTTTRGKDTSATPSKKVVTRI
mmetsp:Transcript_6458/g.24268  ORF Transcript_6458/g.24268 Transcript_6458/m.24268 type:complete len:257 (-) Transcript_6458:722-1492(-)|eukprot:CAMPEP_0117447394 /NCGR_PEP_ID=MMETSP0759-20121206/6853_1 /TAXON_ID=63605 /ORGANISM="Percolomonas cosmopolitus, Strain WS" /LENGTH=256 /DNA_ID=CAMNT_0005239729 /DNA_START=414 /DNA_END=1184 /DNA_ORIENTATION=-